MTAEELMTMLDLPAPAEPSELQVSEAEHTAAAPIDLSPTALKLDDWGRRRGWTVLEESDTIRKAFGLPDFDMTAKNPDIKGMSDAIESVADLAADFHGAAFEPEPTLAKHCENERVHRYMQQLLETPEFKALHAETQLDDVASEIATISFAKQWVELSKVEPGEGLKEDMACMRAGCRALSEATSEVKELRSAQDALGIGHREIAHNFKRVKSSPQLRKICELAGRYRRLAQAQQRRKVLHGRDDVVGVVLDGDVGRLLPHELVALCDPDLELDAMRRIVERQAMCREYRGIEQVARGPIVLVVDESGSMSGEPIWTAKAIALALCWVARQQKRFCCLVGFAGATEGNFLVIPPGKTDDGALMDWLEHFFGGGTDMDVPCEILPSKWEELGCPKGKTNIVCITDAICHIPDKVRKRFLDWKAVEKVRMISLIINSEPGDLAGVSDVVHRVPSLSVELEAVAEVLSV